MMSNTRSPRNGVLQPAVLTLLAAAIAAVLTLFFAWPQVVLYCAILPVPLAVLWLSNSEPDPAERIAAFDAAHHVAR